MPNLISLKKLKVSNTVSEQGSKSWESGGRSPGFSAKCGQACTRGPQLAGLALLRPGAAEPNEGMNKYSMCDMNMEEEKCI